MAVIVIRVSHDAYLYHSSFVIISDLRCVHNSAELPHSRSLFPIRRHLYCRGSPLDTSFHHEDAKREHTVSKSLLISGFRGIAICIIATYAMHGCVCIKEVLYIIHNGYFRITGRHAVKLNQMQISASFRRYSKMTETWRL